MLPYLGTCAHMQRAGVMRKSKGFGLLELMTTLVVVSLLSAIPIDPWDQPYVYFDIATAGPGNVNFRKDKNLNPLNTDFDLYSSGKDGESKRPLNAKASREDIVQVNNGAFIGLAEDH